MYRQVHMGMQVRVVLYADSETRARSAARATFEEIARLDDVFSDYRRGSELSRLAAAPAGSLVPISGELFAVLARARQLALQTNGAFDVTAAPITRLWRQAIASGQPPDPSQVERARRLTGHDKLALDAVGRTATLSFDDMALDLGGIAKGYVLDRARDVLRQHRIERALVEAGGDIAVGSAPPGRSGWRVEVPHLGTAPGAAAPERAANPEAATRRCVLEVADAAISTSGAEIQFVEIDGRRYSHTVDPRTGLGLMNQVTATVVAADGMTADSLATALTIIGEEEGRRLLELYPRARAIWSLSDCVNPPAKTPDRRPQRTDR